MPGKEFNPALGILTVLWWEAKVLMLTDLEPCTTSQQRSLEPSPKLAVTKTAPPTEACCFSRTSCYISGKQSGRRDRGLSYLVKRKPGVLAHFTPNFSLTCCRTRGRDLLFLSHQNPQVNTKAVTSGEPQSLPVILSPPITFHKANLFCHNMLRINWWNCQDLLLSLPEITWKPQLPFFHDVHEKKAGRTFLLLLSSQRMHGRKSVSLRTGLACYTASCFQQRVIQCITQQ